MTDSIKMGKLPGYTSHCDSCEPIGHVLMETSYGPVLATEVSSVCALTVTGGDKPSTIAVMTYLPQLGTDPGVGLICQMSAETARHLAASLLHLASTIDAGVVQ